MTSHFVRAQDSHYSDLTAGPECETMTLDDKAEAAREVREMMNTCAHEGCTLGTTGKSKYCRRHRDAAREAWKTRITEQAEEREIRYANFEILFRAAWEAGMAAGLAALPTPMVVQQHASALDDSSPVVKSWRVPEGVCGFGWVTVRPGNSSFARWLVKTGRASKAYRGGVQVWIGEHGQSYERKVAHARAMADLLKAWGVKAYSGGRLD